MLAVVYRSRGILGGLAVKKSWSCGKRAKME